MSQSGLYGYFTSPEQTRAVYDPGLDATCPICGDVLDLMDIRTVSLMVPNDNRSYFYRVHRTCHEPLSKAERIKVDSLLIDAIYSARNTN